jgi:hypothetical protein
MPRANRICTAALVTADALHTQREHANWLVGA